MLLELQVKDTGEEFKFKLGIGDNLLPRLFKKEEILEFRV